MSSLPINRDIKNDDSLFKRPTGVLLEESQWLYLKERYAMTPRELQTAILVCRGFSNDEIAKALKIRHGTVKTHLRNIYRRTRVKSKITLLLTFIEDVSKFYGTSKAGKPPIPIVEKVQSAGFPTSKLPDKK